jgi:FG-GAP-like repeat
MGMLRPATAAALLLVAPAALAATDIVFEPAVPVALPHGTLPSRLLAEDLTGDGTLDVLVTPSMGPQVVARAGLGGLAFAPAATTTLPAKVGYGWALGDMDGDGLPDLVASLTTTPVALHVLTSAGDGSFAPSSALILALPDTTVGSVALLDADLDGALDVAVGHSNSLFTALGDGAGGVFVPYPPHSSLPISLGGSLHRVDLNADGDSDLIGVGYASSTWAWITFANDGDGIFGVTPQSASGFADLFASAVGDLDGNSWPDLVVSSFDSDLFFLLKTLQQAYGNGTTVVGDYPGDLIEDPYVYQSLQLGDLDGDGLDDLVGTSTDVPLGTLSVRPNDGGVLQPAQVIPLLQAVHAAQLRDMDSDGRLDVVVAHLGADALSILLNDTLATGWSVLGGALAGSSGKPELTGTGALQAGETVRLRLTHALPAAPVWLVIGAGLANLPFKGGALMPTPDAVFPGLVTDVTGFLTLASTWPSGVPSGLEAWMQEWIADPAGPKGFAASNAVVAKTP